MPSFAGSSWALVFFSDVATTNNCSRVVEMASFRRLLRLAHPNERKGRTGIKRSIRPPDFSSSRIYRLHFYAGLGCFGKLFHYASSDRIVAKNERSDFDRRLRIANLLQQFSVSLFARCLNLCSVAARQYAKRRRSNCSLRFRLGDIESILSLG